MNVYTTTEVKQYLNDLITILYKKEYFGYEESAHRYVDELLDEILTQRRHGFFGKIYRQ